MSNIWFEITAPGQQQAQQVHLQAIQHGLLALLNNTIPTDGTSVLATGLHLQCMLDLHIGSCALLLRHVITKKKLFSQTGRCVISLNGILLLRKKEKKGGGYLFYESPVADSLIWSFRASSSLLYWVPPFIPHPLFWHTISLMDLECWWLHKRLHRMLSRCEIKGFCRRPPVLPSDDLALCLLVCGMLPRFKIGNGEIIFRTSFWRI